MLEAGGRDAIATCAGNPVAQARPVHGMRNLAVTSALPVIRELRQTPPRACSAHLPFPPQAPSAMATTLPLPDIQTDEKVKEEEGFDSLWNVLLFDDDEHSYAYVVEMMMNLFGMSPEEGFSVAYDVDHIGQAVVKTCPHDEAVAAQKAIISYGPDWRMAKSSGSMGCVIEKADG